MNAERYEELMQDLKIIKFAGAGYHFYHDLKDELVVQILFVHTGIPNGSVFMNKNRFLIQTYSFEDISRELVPSTSFTEFKDETVFMVNADSKDYAATYILQNDKLKKEIRIKLSELPEVSLPSIIDYELEGITHSY